MSAADHPATDTPAESREPLRGLERASRNLGHEPRVRGAMRRRYRRLALPTLAVVLSAGLAGCSLLTLPTPDPRAAALRTLDDAEARWRASAIVDYTYDLARSCFCPELAITISVVGGQTRAVTKDGGPVRPDELVSVPLTIPDLFAVIRREIGRGADAGPTTVTYDATRGFPVSASFDPILNAVDDEYAFTVSNLRLPD